MSHPLCSIVSCLIHLFFPALLAAATYHVAPPESGGDNANPGTLAAPFATIQRAATVAAAGDTVLIRAGVYRETISPASSGTVGARITYRNYENEVVTISGADVLSSASWTLDTGSIYHAPLAANFFTSSFNQALQVFVDGEMVILAKWPDVTTKTNAYPSGTAPPVDISHPAKSTTSSFVSKTRDNTARLTTGVVIDTALPPRPAGFYDGAEIYFQPNNNAWSWLISGVVTQVPANGNQITFTSRSDSGKDFNQNTYDPASRYYLFNKKEFLDTPGEWWHDRANGRLYLWTPTSASPATSFVEVKKRDFAFNLSNRSHITIQGLRLFACSISTDTASGGSALGYDANGNTIYPWRGAGYLAPSTGIVIDGILGRYLNHFTDVSGHFFLQWGTCTGIVLSGTGHTIRNSTLEKTAGNGIGLQGHGHTVFNNTLLDIAYAGTDAAAINTVAAGIGTDHVVSYNTIRRTGRSGITPRSLANSDAAGGHFRTRFHHNDIAYFGIQDWDVGGFYVAFHDGRFVRIDHNLISEGRGFISAGVYLDYTKNYIIHHNVVWNVEWGIKVHGDSGGVNNTLVYNNTSSVRNLSSTPYGPFAIGNGAGVNNGTVLRNNLLTLVTPPAANGYNAITNGTFTGAEIAANLAWNGVANSSTDPRFVSAAVTLDATGVDYRIQAGSAAIDAGTVIGSYVRDGITVPAFPDPFTGSAPDIGAYEFGLPPWRAGASATQCAPPEFSTPPGSYTGSVQLALVTPTPDAVIRYTVDGSTPTATTGLVYNAPFTLQASATVRAVATAPGLAASPVILGLFEITRLELLGNNVLIPLHDATPQIADHTDFGSVEAGFASLTRTFTLRNLSDASINLTGPLPLTLEGSAAFTLLDQPALVLAPGASTSFRIRFSTTSPGTASAVVRIAQTDLPGGAYDFAIGGTALAAQPALALAPSALAVNRPVGSASSVALALANTGRAPLAWSISAPPASGFYGIADSASGGPAFAWRDTAAGGTVVMPNTDDNITGAISLGFAFPYFGASYTQVYISSNGYLTFTGGSPNNLYTNFTLPTANLHAQSIALFWDDLGTDANSSITWKRLDAQTFGVTYQNVARIGNAATQRTTAQILLKADGRVVLQYKDNTIPNGYTIGYQTTTSVGRTIAHNTAFLSTGANLNRALTLLPPASWLSGLSPASGSIPPGGTQYVALSLTTSGLIAGLTYATTLTLLSNDLAAPSTLVPFTLTVSDLPSAPADLRLSIHSSTELGLSWSDLASNETGFQVERSADGATGWTQIAALPADSGACLDPGLPAGAHRHYRVRAVNAAGASAWSPVVTNAPPPLPYFVRQSFADAAGTAAPSLAPVPGILAFSGSGSVQNSAALSYSGLASSGRGFATANGRFFMTLDMSLPALAPFIANGRVGGANTGVLYVGWLARGINAQEANAIEFRTGTSSDTDNTVAIGTTFGNAYIRLMGSTALNGGVQNYVTSAAVPSSGVDLYVAKFSFGSGATSRVDVFINQTAEGTPDATLTGYAQFNVVGFAKYGSAAAPSIDEVRFAPIFAGAVLAEPAPAYPPPVLSSLGPVSGPASGGTAVTLAGAEFGGVLGIAFGGVPAASFEVVSPTRITAIAPARAAGVFHVTVTTLGGSDTLEDAFTFTSLTPFQSWLSGYGLPADGTGIGAPIADPDGDGVANLLEYALAGDPLTADSTVLPVPTLTPSFPPSLQLSFLRARPDLNYLVESSSNLAAWQNVPYVAVPVGGIQTVTDPEPASTETSPRRFLRLRVTAP